MRFGGAVNRLCFPRALKLLRLLRWNTASRRRTIRRGTTGKPTRCPEYRFMLWRRPAGTRTSRKEILERLLQTQDGVSLGLFGLPGSCEVRLPDGCTTTDQHSGPGLVI